ncbi:MAG: hypothetical protein IKN64_04915 [Desulfovibrio sp.]|nr:hypothetical protein [Desulfovibrio sp.]
MSHHTLPTLSTPSSSYPDRDEIDRNWVPVEQFLKDKGLLDSIFESDLFLAVDSALRELGENVKIVVLTQNSQHRLCVNPCLVPGMEAYFANYEPQSFPLFGRDSFK